MKFVIEKVRDEFLLAAFSIVLVALMIYSPADVYKYPQFIDWHTIFMLIGLIIITTGIAQSNLLNRLSFRMILKTRSEMLLALKLITLTLVLSAFVTNDISLFIVIPITMSLQKFIKDDLGKLIIFEAIAANIGSALTPIGNPQNIYLFHLMHISFLKFIGIMLPMEVVLLSVLFIFIPFIFTKRIISLRGNNGESMVNENKKLFYVSLSFLIVYILVLNVEKPIFIGSTAIIFVVYLLFFPDVIKKTDWWLIVLFCVMFIDFGMIVHVSFIQRFVAGLVLSNKGNLFLFSAGSSQIISNVPASIFVSHFSHNYKIIAYGVNIGGNGIIIGSLANIIAIRLSKRNLIAEFHKYSIPFFLITTFTMFALLKFFFPSGF